LTADGVSWMRLECRLRNAVSVVAIGDLVASSEHFVVAVSTDLRRFRSFWNLPKEMRLTGEIAHRLCLRGGRNTVF
jgi:hypothetical protein